MIPRPSYRVKESQQLDYKAIDPSLSRLPQKSLIPRFPHVALATHQDLVTPFLSIPSVNEPSPQSSRGSNGPSIDWTRLQPRKLTAKRVDGPTGVRTRSLPISTGLASRFSLLILLLSLSSKSLNQEQELVMKERKRRT